MTFFIEFHEIMVIFREIWTPKLAKKLGTIRVPLTICSGLVLAQFNYQARQQLSNVYEASQYKTCHWFY